MPGFLILVDNTRYRTEGILTERRLKGDLRVQRDLRRAEEGAGAAGGPQGVPDTAAEPEAGLQVRVMVMSCHVIMS